MVTAVDDVSFDVRGGEFFGIVGRNGCGKSTLLRTLSSIYRVDRGTVRVAGRVGPLIELGVGFDHQLARALDAGAARSDTPPVPPIRLAPVR